MTFFIGKKLFNFSEFDESISYVMETGKVKISGNWILFVTYAGLIVCFDSFEW